MNNDINLQQKLEDEIFENDDLYPSVNNAITRIAEEEGYIHHTIYKKKISTDGGNYLGVLYEIDIKGETVEGNKQETNIFIKQVIPNSEKVKLMSLSELYGREIFFYKDLGKIIIELQNKVNIPKENKFRLTKMFNNCDIDAIMLENMSKQGFKIYNRFEVMNYDYATLCVEHLARFHGLSFVIERRMPEYFEKKIKSLNYPITIDEEFKKTMDIFYAAATKNLPRDQKMKTDKWWKTMPENYPKYLQGMMTDVKCLCHGDYKMNNIMYKEMDGKVTEVLPIDYQIINYGSPVVDLIFYIYLGSDQEFRRKHLEHLKDHYYVTLKKYLEYFAIPISDVYPRKMFEKDFEYCLDCALVFNITLLPLWVTDKTLDLGDLQTFEAMVNYDSNVHDRIQGVLDDCFKWDLY